LRRKPLPLSGFLATRDNRVAKKPLKTNPPPRRCAGEGAGWRGDCNAVTLEKRAFLYPFIFLNFIRELRVFSQDVPALWLQPWAHPLSNHPCPPQLVNIHSQLWCIFALLLTLYNPPPHCYHRKAGVCFNLGEKASRLSCKCLSLSDFSQRGSAPLRKITFLCAP